MKAVQSRHIALTDLFRAVAGDAAAQFDMIACTVYSAAYSIMQAGNKTQFSRLESDAKLYGADTKDAGKACRDAVGTKTSNAASKHFHRVYAAIHATLAAFPAPELVRDLPKGKDEQHAILDPLASDYADAFTMNFTTLMTAPARTANEEAQAKAERAAKREAKERAALKAQREHVNEVNRRIGEEAAKLSAAQVAHATAPDVMARTVADLLIAGALPAELEALLIEAAQTRETALLLARAASTKPETVEA